MSFIKYEKEEMKYLEIKYDSDSNLLRFYYRNFRVKGVRLILPLLSIGKAGIIKAKSIDDLFDLIEDKDHEIHHTHRNYPNSFTRIPSSRQENINSYLIQLYKARVIHK